VPTVSMKDLLQSGVHFGHQTRRWNPKMRTYIFTERGGIYIIDLQKTTVLIDEAYSFLRNIAARGGKVLFVGTKKQCQETIKEEAEATGMPYVCTRWLGGLLTNYATLAKRIKRLHELRELIAEGSVDVLPTRDQMKLRAELAKLETNLGGVAGMDSLPSAVFVVDPRKEAIVVKEARKLGIPIVALVDTNCDPDEVDYVIPGNDDAIRSCAVIVKAMARAVADGKAQITVAEFKEADEKPKPAARSEAAAATPRQSAPGKPEAAGPRRPAADKVEAAVEAVVEAAAAEIVAEESVIKAATTEAVAEEAVVAAAVTEAVAEAAVDAGAPAEVVEEAVVEAAVAEMVAEEAVAAAAAADEVATEAVAEAVVDEVVAEEAVTEAEKAVADEPAKKTRKPTERKPAKSGAGAAAEKAERPAEPEKAEKPAEPEKAERPAKPEKAEKPAKPEKPAKAEKSAKPEKDVAAGAESGNDKEESEA
jgi:small subunit ribosomal protein S2